MQLLVMGGIAVTLVAWLLAEGTSGFAQPPPRAPETEVESGAAVEPAPPGVRRFTESAVFGATSLEPFRWDQQWDGVRFGDFDQWTAIHDCGMLTDLLASASHDALYVVGIQEWFYYSGCIADGLLRRALPARASHFSRRSPLEDVVERLDI